MPDNYGNPVYSDLVAGQSPLTQAAVLAFQQNALPVIQNQFALQGLSNSPALGQAVGNSLAQTLPQFILGGEQLNQSGAQTLANIQNLQNQNQLASLQMANNLYGTLGQQATAAGQLQGSQLTQALQGLQGAGQLQQGTTQNLLDTAYQDYLRRQGLAEQSTTGLFGGSVLPPTLQQAGTSNTTSSK